MAIYQRAASFPAQKPYNDRMSYPIPEQSLEIEYEVKKSRFITRVGPVTSRKEAMTFLEQAKVDFPDARHHCWAYILGNPKSPLSAAMSDDGEPSGTAGKPILNVLQHKQVGDIMAIVIRYFGGIKLGAGGLVRAYSTSCQQAFEQLKLIEQIPCEAKAISCDFQHEQALRHWLTQHEAQQVTAQYHQRVLISAQLPSQHTDALDQFAAQFGAGMTTEKT